VACGPFPGICHCTLQLAAPVGAAAVVVQLAEQLVSAQKVTDAEKPSDEHVVVTDPAAGKPPKL